MDDGKAPRVVRVVAGVDDLVDLALIAVLGWAFGMYLGGSRGPAAPSIMHHEASPESEKEEKTEPIATPPDGKKEIAGEARQASPQRIRGLPPQGSTPPVANPDKLKIGPASRSSEQAKGGQSLWDEAGGDWRYYPEDKWHNPHWDYNPHKPGRPNWNNVPIDNLPTRK